MTNLYIMTFASRFVYVSLWKKEKKKKKGKKNKKIGGGGGSGCYACWKEEER